MYLRDLRLFSKTYIINKFVDDALVKFVLDVLVARQHETTIGQSGGRRVESSQHKQSRLQEGQIFSLAGVALA